MNRELKRIVLICCIFVLFIATLALIETYALFETNASAISNLTIGKWVIEINHTDVTLEETLTLNSFTYTSGIHTQPGYFAPGSTAELLMEIDVSETDVSVIYELEIDDSVIRNYPNLTFSVLDLDTNQELETLGYRGLIPLSSQNRVKRLKINLNWNDDILYDESDTSLIGGNLGFNIRANFKQYVGETYTPGPYTPIMYTGGTYTGGEYTPGTYTSGEYTPGEYTSGEYTP